MVRISLALLMLVTAALAPAAAMSIVDDSHRASSLAESHCGCCDDVRIDAALACAAFCHAALPSLAALAPNLPRSLQALPVLTAEGEGLTLEPPAPPPRS